MVVNILTNLAFHQGKIKVFGGSQLRPNIHIEDMVEVYCQLIEAPSRMIAETFNAGYENQSVMGWHRRSVMHSKIPLKLRSPRQMMIVLSHLICKD